MKKKGTFDSFAQTSWLDDLNRRIAAHDKSTNFNSKEAALLTLFFDDRLKIRKRLVPKFAMYASACESKPADKWNAAMLEVNLAVLNLLSIGFLEEKKYDSAVGSISDRLAEGAYLYALTAEGLEELQRLRPSVALRLRAWIAVLPPWLVTAGTIAGGVSAVWKLAELILKP